MMCDMASHLLSIPRFCRLLIAARIFFRPPFAQGCNFVEVRVETRCRHSARDDVIVVDMLTMAWDGYVEGSKGA